MVGKNDSVDFANPNNVVEKTSENTKASKPKSASVKTSEKNKRVRSTRNEV